jgi:hypothetical protein
VVAAVLALAVAPTVASAQLSRSATYRGAITGTAFGVPFQLPVAVELAPPIPDEMNPLTVFVGTTGTDPNLNVGHLFVRSASRIPPPFALTLKQMAIQVQGNTIVGTLIESGAGTTAASNNGFSGPNVCQVVAGPQAPLLCIGNTFPAEQFYFVPGSQVVLQLNGATLTGQVRGEGKGLIQLFPYPPVIYDATLTASLAQGDALDLTRDLVTQPPMVVDRTAPALSALRVTGRRKGPSAAVVRIRSSEPGTLTIAVARIGSGLALGPPVGSGPCGTPTQRVRGALDRQARREAAGLHGAQRRRAIDRLRRRARCERLLDRGALKRALAQAGEVTVAVPRRLAGRTLTPGRYRVTAMATDAAGNASPPLSAPFTVRGR